ncbi:DUF1801 domain-containing protein [Edaphocola aurantiacus]|uniref:DUF1801 domain-containing protein n=1 Tax=Edaphocola aurantiacus TaxID=2601682 RepID=UPI001C97EF21|nr:DUF1801 domain-containing protein [Edaphocola aurantiacus]
MAKANKTVFTEDSVTDFIEQVSDAQQRSDSYELVQLMEQCSGKAPRMWGSSIIGFGEYHYKYDSGHEGDAPVIGFSPRKAAISVYVYCDTIRQQELLNALGKFKMGKACIYVKKLEHIDQEVLKEMIADTLQFIDQKYGIK